MDESSEKKNYQSSPPDLSGMLKDSNVSGYRAVKYYRETSTPKIIRWTMKLSGGLIKDEKQASYFVLGFVVVAIIVSLFLFFGGGSFSYQEKIITPIPAAGPGDPNFRAP